MEKLNVQSQEDRHVEDDHHMSVHSRPDQDLTDENASKSVTPAHNNQTL